MNNFAFLSKYDASFKCSVDCLLHNFAPYGESFFHVLKYDSVNVYFFSKI